MVEYKLCNHWAARVSSGYDLLQMQLSHVTEVVTAWCQVKKYGFKEFALYSTFSINYCVVREGIIPGVSENKSHFKSSIKWKDLK